jgi:hypothetical protein
MPMRTLIDLPPRLPRSGDVDFFKLWSQGTAEGDVEEIVDRWWRQDRSGVAKPVAAGGSPAFVPDPAESAMSPAASARPSAGARVEGGKEVSEEVQRRMAELIALLNPPASK